MYKVLLVDDDCLVRTTLKTIINWEKFGFQIAGEAIDGIDAMEKIDALKPDILILDMSMPQADGIDVIKYVQEKCFDIKILVLSCYDDFNYVKEALKLGANDYMLKHLMKEELLMESLHTIKQDIELSREENLAMHRMEKIAEEGASLLKNKLLLKLLHERLTTPKSEQEFKQYCKTLQPNNLAVIFLRVLKYDEVIKAYQSSGIEIFSLAISNIADEAILSKYNYEMVNDEDGKYFIIINLDNYSQLQNKRELEYIISKIGQGLVNHLKINIQCIASIKCTSYMELWKTYGQLDNKINHFFYDQSEKDYLISEELSVVSLEEIKVSDEKMNQYKDYIKKDKFSLLQDTVIEEFNEITKNRIVPINIKKYYIRFLRTIYSYIYEHFNINRDYIFMETTTQHILEAQNTKELYRMIKGIIEDAEKLVSNDLIQTVENDYIKKSIKYIQSHYMDDLILADVAAYIHVSATYFSYLFKKSTGMKFIDYIKEIRMKKACEYLLDTDMKIKEIGELVGIPNRKYFSKLFKEHMGMSPQDYKRQNI